MVDYKYLPVGQERNAGAGAYRAAVGGPETAKTDKFPINKYVHLSLRAAGARGDAPYAVDMDMLTFKRKLRMDVAGVTPEVA